LTSSQSTELVWFFDPSERTSVRRKHKKKAQNIPLISAKACTQIAIKNFLFDEHEEPEESNESILKSIKAELEESYYANVQELERDLRRKPKKKFVRTKSAEPIINTGDSA
jgi:hypothetical protein